MLCSNCACDIVFVTFVFVTFVFVTFVLLTFILVACVLVTFVLVTFVLMICVLLQQTNKQYNFCSKKFLIIISLILFRGFLQISSEFQFLWNLPRCVDKIPREVSIYKWKMVPVIQWRCNLLLIFSAEGFAKLNDESAGTSQCEIFFWNHDALQTK